ncbi:MAG: DNA polymerase III subunit chi [Proteobacteria bacterium]|nr:DNA polymerase III subunit chi [Pseudomonadota bacterium]
MTDIRFYQLQQKKLEHALPEILAKALERQHRVIVKTSNPERLQELDQSLWSYNPESFLPHSASRDEYTPEQPIWLTTEEDDPNQATALILVDGAISGAVNTVGLCCELFDGNDESAVLAARERWKVYKDQGHTLTYFQQDEAGKWQKK